MPQKPEVPNQALADRARLHSNCIFNPASRLILVKNEDIFPLQPVTFSATSCLQALWQYPILIASHSPRQKLYVITSAESLSMRNDTWQILGYFAEKCSLPSCAGTKRMCENKYQESFRALLDSMANKLKHPPSEIQPCIE